MSTISPVTAALVALAGPLLPDTQVVDGPADSVTTLSDRVLVIGSRIFDATRTPDSMTLDSGAEQYTVELVHSVSMPGADTQDDALDLALADYTAVAEAVAAFPGGPNLGLAAEGVLQAVPADTFEVDRFALAEGRSASVRWGVRVYTQTG